MDAVTNLINKIKSRWDGETTTYTEFDTIKILELMHERMIEIDQDLQHHNHHKGKPVTVNHLEIEITRLENEVDRLKRAAGNHHNNWMKSQQELARLRDQLRWHSVDELPEVGKPVLIMTDYGKHDVCRLSFPDFFDGKISWVNDMRPEHSNGSVIKWCYIPDDNQGTDCTPEGE